MEESDFSDAIAAGLLSVLSKITAPPKHNTLMKVSLSKLTGLHNPRDREVGKQMIRRRNSVIARRE